MRGHYLYCKNKNVEIKSIALKLIAKNSTYLCAHPVGRYRFFSLRHCKKLCWTTVKILQVYQGTKEHGCNPLMLGRIKDELMVLLRDTMPRRWARKFSRPTSYPTLPRPKIIWRIGVRTVEEKSCEFLSLQDYLKRLQILRYSKNTYVRFLHCRPF